MTSKQYTLARGGVRNTNDDEPQSYFVIYMYVGQEDYLLNVGDDDDDDGRQWHTSVRPSAEAWRRTWSCSSELSKKKQQKLLAAKKAENMLKTTHIAPAQRRRGWRKTKKKKRNKKRI